jgi:hypothetical protein
MSVYLLNVLNVLYVCLLAFDLVTGGIIESGNCPKGREHPFEIDISRTDPASLCCGLFALGNG